MAEGVFTDLRISGMFWTQNLKPLAVSFALGIVHVAEKSGCPVEKTHGEILLIKPAELLKIALHFGRIYFSYPSILVGYMEPKEV